MPMPLDNQDSLRSPLEVWSRTERGNRPLPREDPRWEEYKFLPTFILIGDTQFYCLKCNCWMYVPWAHFENEHASAAEEWKRNQIR